MSCLFQSLATELQPYMSDVLDAQTLRQKICNYLALKLESSPLMQDNVQFVLEQQDPQLQHTPELYTRYVTWMRQPETWGGALEIFAFAQLYQCQVVCYVGNMAQPMTFQPEHTTQKFQCYIHWNGSHYEPCSSKNDSCQTQ